MNHHRVKPDQAVNLHDHDANDTGDYKNKEEATERTEHLRQKLDALQELLYSERSRAVLVVLQGIDTAGLDMARYYASIGSWFETPILPASTLSTEAISVSAWRDCCGARLRVRRDQRRINR